jgi:hypothetical protein
MLRYLNELLQNFPQKRLLFLGFFVAGRHKCKACLRAAGRHKCKACLRAKLGQGLLEDINAKHAYGPSSAPKAHGLVYDINAPHAALCWWGQIFAYPVDQGTLFRRNIPLQNVSKNLQMYFGQHNGI